MTLMLNIGSELEMQVRQEAAKHELEVNDYVVHVVQEHLRHDQENTLSCLNEEESQLLQKINIGLPQETWQHYRGLTQKRRDENLTSKEQKELIQISDHLEQLNACRMEHLVKLAQLRNLPVRSLMKQLGITPANV